MSDTSSGPSAADANGRPNTPSGAGGGPPRTVAREKRARWPGLVWALPIAALLIVLYLGLQALAHAGTDVEVSFSSAADAKPGDTQVVYKGLSVGRVTKVHLNKDRRQVDMTLRVDPQLKPELTRGAVFWLVGSKPSLTDINSVKAALAGVSIGFAPGPKGAPAERRFTGLDQPPVVPPGTAGTRYVLISKAANGASRGASVFYHGQEVGKVLDQTLRGENRFETNIFVTAPFDRFVRRGTLFFGVSAVSVSFSGGGLSTQLAPGGAALTGGVEFDTPDDLLDQPHAAEGARFPFHTDRGKALSSPRGPEVFYRVDFTDPVGELEVGAPVKLRGFSVGTVAARTIRFDPGTGRLSTPVVIALEPDRLNGHGPSDLSSDLSGWSDGAVAKLVAEGYRARLTQNPPLVGARIVELAKISGAPRAALAGARSPGGYPVIPAASAGDVGAIMAKADDILGKVQQVPIAEIGADVKRITTHLAEVVSSPKLKSSLDHLQSTLSQIDATVAETRPKIGPLIDKLNSAADQVQGLTVSANRLISTDGATEDASVPSALRELTDAARSLRSLADYLTRHPEAILRGKAKSQ